MKINPGADVTVISKELYKIYLSNTKLSLAGRLTLGGDIPLEIVSKTQAELEWRNKKVIDYIYVIKSRIQSLLGRAAIAALNIFSWPKTWDEFIEAVTNKDGKSEKEFAQIFKGLGCIKKDKSYHIKIQDNAKPFAISAPRRIPLHLLEKVKKKLKRMTKMGIITPIKEATEWCAPMVVMPKPNKKSQNLRRLYTVKQKRDKSAPYDAHSRGKSRSVSRSWGVSILDANKGYYQILLSKKSKLLTTFITPFRRFCFNRLPMGPSSLGEHFQRNISQILDNIKGTVNLRDDTLVYGTSEEDHDRKLREVLKKLHKAGVTLNKSKCKISVKFLRYIVLVGKEIKPDKNKVRVIIDMKKPRNVTEIKRFLGMVHYQLKFVERLVDMTKPLRDLLKEETEFVWTVLQEETFFKIKKRLAEALALVFFDPNKKTRISADSSAYGLEAVCEQKTDKKEWQSIYYASRALTQSSATRK